MLGGLARACMPLKLVRGQQDVAPQLGHQLLAQAAVALLQKQGGKRVEGAAVREGMGPQHASAGGVGRG